MATPYFLYQHTGLFVLGIFLLSIWSLIWKGLALWRAGTRKDLVWFILILVLNTAGILPIIYLLVTKEAKKKKPKIKEAEKKEVKTGSKTVSVKTVPKVQAAPKVTKKKSSGKKTAKKKVTKKIRGKT